MKLTRLNIVEKIKKLGAKSHTYKSVVRKLPKIEREYFEKHQNFILNKLKQSEEKEQAKILKDLQKENAKKFNMSVKEYSALKEKASILLECLNTGHSMGCYRTLRMNGEEFATNHYLATYSKSYRFEPTYGDIEVNLTKKQLREVEIIGGIPTIIGSPTEENPKVRHCTILKQSGSKQYYKLKWKGCYITSDFHGSSVDMCEQWRKQQAERLLNIRTSKNREKANLSRFVGLQHSIQVGNCKAGTEAFARKHGLNPEWGYRVDYLISLEDSRFTRRLLSI